MFGECNSQRQRRALDHKPKSFRITWKKGRMSMRKLNVATAAIVVATVLAATGAAFAQERAVKITGFGAG